MLNGHLTMMPLLSILKQIKIKDKDKDKIFIRQRASDGH
jgi:hypothetical protein